MAKKAAAKKSTSLSRSAATLQKQLAAHYKELREVQEECDGDTVRQLAPYYLELVEHRILHHGSERVRCLAAACLAQILRLSAPPEDEEQQEDDSLCYNTSQLQLCFSAFLAEMVSLGDSIGQNDGELIAETALLSERMLLLETLADYNMCALLLEFPDRAERLCTWTETMLDLCRSSARVARVTTQLLTDLLGHLDDHVLAQNDPMEIPQLLVDIVLERIVKPSDSACKEVLQRTATKSESLHAALAEFVLKVCFLNECVSDESDFGVTKKQRRRRRTLPEEVRERQDKAIVALGTVPGFFGRYGIWQRLGELMDSGKAATRLRYGRVATELLTQVDAATAVSSKLAAAIVELSQDADRDVRAEATEWLSKLLLCDTLQVTSSGDVRPDSKQEQRAKEKYGIGENVVEAAVLRMTHALVRALFVRTRDSQQAVRVRAVEAAGGVAVSDPARCSPLLWDALKQRLSDAAPAVRKCAYLQVLEFLSRHVVPHWRQRQTALSVPSQVPWMVRGVLCALCPSRVASSRQLCLWLQQRVDQALLGGHAASAQERARVLTACVAVALSAAEQDTRQVHEANLSDFLFEHRRILAGFLNAFAELRKNKADILEHVKKADSLQCLWLAGSCDAVSETLQRELKTEAKAVDPKIRWSKMRQLLSGHATREKTDELLRAVLGVSKIKEAKLRELQRVILRATPLLLTRDVLSQVQSEFLCPSGAQSESFKFLENVLPECQSRLRLAALWLLEKATAFDSAGLSRDTRRVQDLITLLLGDSKDKTEERDLVLRTLTSVLQRDHKHQVAPLVRRHLHAYLEECVLRGSAALCTTALPLFLLALPVEERQAGATQLCDRALQLLRDLEQGDIVDWTVLESALTAFLAVARSQPKLLRERAGDTARLVTRALLSIDRTDHIDRMDDRTDDHSDHVDDHSDHVDDHSDLKSDHVVGESSETRARCLGVALMAQSAQALLDDDDAGDDADDAECVNLAALPTAFRTLSGALPARCERRVLLLLALVDRVDAPVPEEKEVQQDAILLSAARALLELCTLRKRKEMRIFRWFFSDIRRVFVLAKAARGDTMRVCVPFFRTLAVLLQRRQIPPMLGCLLPLAASVPCETEHYVDSADDGSVDSAEVLPAEMARAQEQARRAREMRSLVHDTLALAASRSVEDFRAAHKNAATRDTATFRLFDNVLFVLLSILSQLEDMRHYERVMCHKLRRAVPSPTPQDEEELYDERSAEELAQEALDYFAAPVAMLLRALLQRQARPLSGVARNYALLRHALTLVLSNRDRLSPESPRLHLVARIAMLVLDKLCPECDPQAKSEFEWRAVPFGLTVPPRVSNGGPPRLSEVAHLLPERYEVTLPVEAALQAADCGDAAATAVRRHSLVPGAAAELAELRSEERRQQKRLRPRSRRSTRKVKKEKSAETAPKSTEKSSKDDIFEFSSNKRRKKQTSSPPTRKMKDDDSDDGAGGAGGAGRVSAQSAESEPETPRRRLRSRRGH